MAATPAQPQPRALLVRVTQEILPPHHERHGTPHPVVERVFAFEFPEGTAVIDQTDYGHTGRFNPCHARSIATALQPKTDQLVAAAEVLAALLSS